MYLELKLLILKNFPTQADFAMRVGCYESKVSGVVRGRRKLSPEDGSKWAQVLNCPTKLLNPVIYRGERRISAKYSVRNS